MALPTTEEMKAAGLKLSGAEIAQALAFWGGLKLIAHRSDLQRVPLDGVLQNLRERLADASSYYVALGSDARIIDPPPLYEDDRDLLVMALDLLKELGRRAV